MLNTFGFSNFKVELSVRDPKNKTKYLGSDEIWKKAENALEYALKQKELNYRRAEGEAVFYGPKIDIKLIDALGRGWQGPTIQVDFNLPEKFDLNYIDEKGKKERIVMIHHTVLGAMERFMGIIVEHNCGAFPVWLSPIQVMIVSVTDRNLKFAENVKKSLEEKGIRVEVDYNSNTVEYKVRSAELQKVPFILTVGDKEEKSNSIAVRTRDGKVKFDVKIEDFINQILDEIKNKK
jgi:threonyl-tRNA synthetase